jgi:hypothetical protein
MSPKPRFPVALFSILLCLSGASLGQAWSGILAPSRAIDWSSAGAGAIPARSTICQTLGTAGQGPSYNQNVTVGQIMAALNACANTGQAVLLNPGTYTFSTTLFGGSGGVNPTPSNVTLRGSGPTQTILKWTGTSNNCNGLGPVAFCVINGDSNGIKYTTNQANWVGGYAQGSTSITLGNVFSGSLSALKVGSLLTLDQLDDNSDSGNWYACGNSGSNGDCSQQGAENADTGRTQSQTVTVTSISGSTIGISPGLYAPTWRSSQTPHALWSINPPVTSFGIENLQINTQAVGDIQAMVQFMWTKNSWIKNVSFINAAALGAAARKHVEVFESAHITVRDSYMYGSSPSSEGYGVDFMSTSCDNLAENNIFQHMATATMLENGCGNVFGYNYAVDNFYIGAGDTAPAWQQCDAMHHSAFDYFDLWEGHEGTCASFDDIHGASFGITNFRNYLSGRDLGGSTPPSAPKTENTSAYFPFAYARYNNLVGSVLGTQNYHTNYNYQATAATQCGNGSTAASTVFLANWSDQNGTQFSNTCLSTSFSVNNDLTAGSSLMRWGNYAACTGDSSCNAVRFVASENGSGASTYPGLANPSQSLPPSFYLSSKPAFWGSMPWPAIGPDVTGGDVGNVGGHVYHNPAANCYLNVLGGATDGSSGVLAFDANNCYTASGGTPPAPPTGLSAVAH